MSSHVEMELLAYLDGELDERKRAQVDAHLAECPRCAAELEQLRALSQGLDLTFDAALTPVRLPAAADARIRDHLRGQLRTQTEPRALWKLWQRRGVFAQALLAALVLVYALAAWQTTGLPLPTTPHETLVLGQERLAPGSQAAMRVLVRSSAAATRETVNEAAPLEGAEVIVLVGRTPGLASIVYTGYTDASGTADVTFTVPDDLEGEASLVVETASAEGADRIVYPITIARDYKLFLSSDKPAYRPGQTIHLRTLTLAATGLRPAAGQEIAFDVLGPDNLSLERDVVAASDFGIAALDVSLPSNAAHGPYTLRATLGDTVSERVVDVGAYELPAFRITVETERAFYGPGERVIGFVQTEYFFGKPVANGQVTLRGYVGAERVQAVQVLGEADEWGRFEFAFDLPPGLGYSALEKPEQLEMEIIVANAAGQREGIRHVIPVAARSIVVAAVPESSLLKPGVENVIYILTSYPDGRPAETALTIVVDGREHALATGPYGLAEFIYIPTEFTARFDVRARDAQGAEGRGTFSFDPDRAAATLLLRADRAVYEVGDTLLAEALLGGTEEIVARTVYLDAVLAEQTIATFSAPVEDGRAVFALDLDGTMIGTLELYAYHVLPGGEIVRGDRTVVVNAPRQVLVAVSADQDEYRPGETAHLELQSDQPAALGIGVVDESVYAIETQPPSFARAYFLLERELLKQQAPVPGFDLPAMVAAETEIQAAQNVAAQAALSGVSAPGHTLSVRSAPGPGEDAAVQAARARRSVLSNRLGILLALLPLLLSGVVVQGLRPTGVLEQALRRVAVGFLVSCVASPLLILVVGGVMWLLWAVLGVGAPVLVLLGVLGLLGWLVAHGWRQRDARVQLATGLFAAYLALGGMLVILAARGGDLQGTLLALVMLTFLLAVAALATLGQGLVLEGWRRSGWAATLMGLLLIPLAVYLPFVPGLASDLTHSVGNPVLYTGPIGWLTGCGQPEVVRTVEITVPAQEIEVVVTSPPEVVTVEVVVEVEVPAEAVVVTLVEPTELEPTSPPPTPVSTATSPPVPTAAPEPTDTPPATPEPAPAPDEPFPLRQVFPETLYWNAEALTDENGYLALDLPLADNVTTWRLTALASTQDGELGVTTYDIVVFQDLFVDFDLPESINQGERVTVTVTLYNYLPQPQTVWVDPAPDLWYELVSPPPQTLTLPPNDVTTTQFVIRAKRLGTFGLQVTTAGERTSDAVIREVTVEP